MGRRSARLAAAGTGAGVRRARDDAFRKLRQPRLVGSRLLALPPELLHGILRDAGRPTRAVCRLFRTAYGPLSEGLDLQGTTTRRALLTLAPAPPATPPFAHIQTLAFAPAAPLTPALLSALPPAFPALRSLHLIPPRSRTSTPDHSFTALAPLSRTLTHLNCDRLNPSALPILASALPHLRSLRLYPTGAGPPTLSALTAAGPLLPHLRNLELFSGAAHSAQVLLDTLAGSLPRLTCLILKDALAGFNSEAAATLASAWPHLADLELYVYGRNDEGAPGLLAAVAQHTALTRLVVSCPSSTGWELLGPLPLRELRTAHWRDWGNVPQGLPETITQLREVTKLVLEGSEYVVDEALTGRLAHMANSLLSLHLQAALPEWGHLVALTSLSRLQDLTLEQAERWVDDQDVTEGQAAAGLAAGLSRLHRLDLTFLYHRNLARPLVACLGVHGCLRELCISAWDPRWPVRLEAVAATLVRLTVACPKEQVPLAVSSLRGLHRLLYLRIITHPIYSESFPDDPTGEYMAAPHPQPSTGSGPAAAMEPCEPDATAWPEWGLLEAGARAAAEGGGGAGRGAGRVWLPPRLRVLVVTDLHEVPAGVMRALEGAARQQGCVVRTGDVKPAWDDCGGYEEGASLEWLRRHGRL